MRTILLIGVIGLAGCSNALSANTRKCSPTDYECICYINNKHNTPSELLLNATYTSVKCNTDDRGRVSIPEKPDDNNDHDSDDNNDHDNNDDHDSDDNNDHDNNDDDHDNDHDDDNGNDSDDGDHNNGHGNDDDRDDDSNPGKGHGHGRNNG